GEAGMTTATSADGAKAKGAEANGMEVGDTFPKLLAGLARTRPRQPAYREKEYGIWQTYDWAHVAREGERVVGATRPRLYWAMAAAQALGGVPVPVYQDSVTEELAYVVDHAGARYAIA